MSLMVRAFPVFTLFSCLAVSTTAQSVPAGSVSGIVQIDGPAAGLRVTAVRLNSAPPVVIATATNAQGAFTLSNIPDGIYEICAEGDKNYPNSCYCVPPPLHPRATVSGGQAVTGVQLRLKKAATVHVRLNDANNTLQAARSDGSATHVM